MTDSDDALVARLIAELDARGEDFTRGPPAPLPQRRRRPPTLRVAEVIRRVWGPEALERLPPHEREGELTVAGEEPCVWIEEFHEAGTRSGRSERIFYEGGVWVPLHGLDGWKRLVTSLAIDLVEKPAQAAVLAAFVRLVNGTIVDTREEAARLSDPPAGTYRPFDEPPVPADPSVVDLFEPPHFEGRTFVFQANVEMGVLGTEPSFARIAIDASTGAIDVRRLARGLREGRHRDIVVGRAYVDDCGGQRLGPLAGGAGPAAAWLDAARAEHASVASFARASMELMSVGAPLDLVRRTHEAALDEVRHTRLSLDVARRWGAVGEPGPLPALAPRAATIASVATTTLLEAAVNETLAAFGARVAARRCAGDDVREVLLGIAADEERHATLAWDVVAWACAVDGDARARVRELAATIGVPASASRSDDDGCGQLTATTEQAAWRVAFDEKVRPRLAALTAA